VFVFSGYSQTNDPVKMKCTIVNIDGSVTFYWENPTIPTDFGEFVFYHSNDGINFTEIGTTASSIINNYTHLTTAGNNSQQFYYIDMVLQSGESIISDTIGTIYFQLDNNDPDFNQADLYWTRVANPLPDGSSSDYQIYWDYPDGNWKLIANSSEDNYSMPVNVCKDSINFKIELENSFCSSVSNIRGNWFKDVGYPEIPVFDSVSVVNSQAVLGWTPSESQDVIGYILYTYESNTWQEFDTVYGINNTFFVDDFFDPCEISKEYAIAAIDSCGNKGEGSFLQPQKPIFFYDIGFNVCKRQDTLIWEQYENSTPEIENYLVWRSVNGSDFEQTADINPNPGSNPPDGISANQMWYIDEDIIPGNTYQYYVQAIFGDRSSTSCIKEISTYSYRIPENLYLANADVQPDNIIELQINVDTDVNECTWEIYRSAAGSSQIDLISSISYADLISNPIIYDDSESQPQQNSYNYYTIVKDSCDIKTIESNILKTIYLSGEKPDTQTNLLQWTEFEGWETEVEKYYIYRISSNDDGLSPIDSVSANTFSYEDIIDESLATNGKFSYWVEAKQTQGGTYNFQSLSRSNRIDLFLESNIFFANAFRPNSTISTNNVFRPVFNFFSGSNYEFMIYNRWGQLIYETSNVQDGWDGTYEGQKQSSALYIYRLTYINIYGKNIELKGSFMLVD